MASPDAKIDLLLSNLNNLEVQFNSLKAAQSVETPVTSDVHGSSSLSAFESVFFSFKTLVMCELSNIKDQLTKQDDKINNLEQYSRRNCVLIHGLKEDSKHPSDMDYVNLALSVFQDKLKLDIQLSHIDRAHRIGAKKSDGKCRPVIVKFVSYYHRRLVFSNKKHLKKTGIHITESLTKMNYQLFTEAKKIYSMENVWTSDGSIFIKDGQIKHKVTTLEELRNVSVRNLTHPKDIPCIQNTSNAPASVQVIPVTPAPVQLKSVQSVRPHTPIPAIPSFIPKLKPQNQNSRKWKRKSYGK